MILIINIIENDYHLARELIMEKTLEGNMKDEETFNIYGCSNCSVTSSV